MTGIDDLPDYKQYLKISEADFKNPHLYKYYDELLTAIKLFLSMQWLDTLIEHPQFEEIFKDRTIGHYIADERDEHGQKGLGLYNFSIRELVSDKLNYRTPYALTHILSAAEMFFSKGLGMNKLSKSALETNIKYITNGRSHNVFDHYYVAVMQKKNLLGGKKYKTISEELIKLAEIADKRNKFIHERFQHNFKIDLNNVIQSWTSACYLVATLDQHIEYNGHGT